MNDIQIDIQIASTTPDLPKKSQLQKWVKSGLQNISQAEITIRIVDEEEMAQLNESYRQKKGSTNVLSFPFHNPISSDVLLGDIVICAPIIKKESQQQAKDEIAHWAHITIHGVLHLQGYDHENEKDAEKMESLETRILKQLGFDDPYQQEN